MPIRSLQHVCLAVPDPTVGRTFYEAFGLDTTERGKSLAFRCAGRDQDQIVLVEGPKKRLHHLCFGTTAAELPQIQKTLEGNGVRLLDPPNEMGPEANGLWFHDPDGLLVNVKVADRKPSRTDPPWIVNTPGHYGRLNVRGAPGRDMSVKPRRLGHTIVFTPNVDRKLDFYIKNLGMRLSDRSGDIIAFMHTAPPSDHHVLALLKDDKTGFHHASFEVGSVDEIEIGAQRLIDKGYRNGWGFGRHVLGSNFFHYIRDPWNSLCEYFCDIDVIPEGATWDARDWPAEDSLYLWGPPTPEDFGRNYEAD
jgi:catechol 2,3-dioxygenase-like lactoylglutathione lyase family enzyme